MLGSLYNTDILTLAATLENSRLDNPDGSVRKVSKLCGSWLEIDINVEAGRVTESALRVQACALGQASAAILKENLVGADRQDITTARDALFDMLKNDGDAPSGRFSRLELLEDVRNYPARHTSTMLAFDAAVDAMAQIVESRH